MNRNCANCGSSVRCGILAKSVVGGCRVWVSKKDQKKCEDCGDNRCTGTGIAGSCWVPKKKTDLRPRCSNCALDCADVGKLTEACRLWVAVKMPGREISIVPECRECGREESYLTPNEGTEFITWICRCCGCHILSTRQDRGYHNAKRNGS